MYPSPEFLRKEIDCQGSLSLPARPAGSTQRPLALEFLYFYVFFSYPHQKINFKTVKLWLMQTVIFKAYAEVRSKIINFEFPLYFIAMALK